MIRRGIHASVIIDGDGRTVIPESTIMEPGCILYTGRGAVIELGEENTFYPACVIRVEHGFVKTGRRVSFGPHCTLYETRGGLTIGDNTLIAGGVSICGAEHGFARTDIPMRDQETSALPVVIGADVWIGMGAIIMPGAIIGDGCVIGAGSVVTGEVPPYSVGKGVPFRKSRDRRQ